MGNPNQNICRSSFTTLEFFNFLKGGPKAGRIDLKKTIDTNNDDKFSREEIQGAIQGLPGDEFSQSVKYELENLRIEISFDRDGFITQQKIDKALEFLANPEGKALANKKIGNCNPETGLSAVYEVMNSITPSTLDQNQLIFKDMSPNELRVLANEAKELYFQKIGALPIKESRIFTSKDVGKIPKTIALKLFKDYIARDNSTHSFAEEIDSHGGPDDVSSRQYDVYLEIPGKEITEALKAGQSYLINNNSRFDFALLNDPFGQLNPLISKASPISLNINLGSKDYLFYRTAFTGSRMDRSIDYPRVQIRTPRELGEYIIKSGLKDLGLTLNDLTSLERDLEKAHQDFPEITDIQLSGGFTYHGQLKFVFKDKAGKVFTAKPLYKSEIAKVGLRNMLNQALKEYKESKSPQSK
jgi:hypothetical protein